MLRGYAVWLPKAGGKEAQIPRAARYAADPRIHHYWDTDGGLMKTYASKLGLDKEEWPEDPWDVYFVFGPEVRWTEAGPPLPDFWMHQLRVLVKNPREGVPYLDGKQLAAKVTEVLSRGLPASP